MAAVPNSGSPPKLVQDFQPEALHERLSRLPMHDLDASVRALVTEINAFNKAVSNPAKQGDALETLKTYVDALLPRLEARLEGVVPPIAPRARSAAYLADSALQGLSQCYLRIVFGRSARWVSLINRRELLGPLVTGMTLVAKRLQLAHQLRARPPRGAWLSLHEAYRVSQRWRIHNRPASGSKFTPNSIYVQALLVSFAEPSRLDSGDLKRLIDYVRKFGHAAHFASVVRTGVRSCAFLVDFTADRPGIAMSKSADAEPSVTRLVLLTTPLVDRLRDHLKQLEAGANPLDLGLWPDRDPARYRQALRKIGTAWRAERRARANRMKFRPRAELRVGFKPAWRHLAVTAQEPASVGLRSPGRILPQDEWAILNESPDGFALRHLRGDVPNAQVGDIAVIVPRDRSETFVCVIRWVQSHAGDQLDMGLQQLAGRLGPLNCRLEGRRGTSVVPILFAPPTSPFNRVPVVIAPAKAIPRGALLAISGPAGEFRCRADRVLESTTHIDLIRIASS